MECFLTARRLEAVLEKQQLLLFLLLQLFLKWDIFHTYENWKNVQLIWFDLLFFAFLAFHKN